MQQETPLTETQQLRFSSRSRSNYGPTLALKEGIDINELTSKGTELEFQTDDLEENFQEMNIESNKAYFQGMQNITRMFDNDSDDDDSGLSWFNRMTLKMKDLTEDGGVKKMIKKEGVGIVVPAGSKIRAHYDGYLDELDEPFDSSRLRKKELQITLGKAEVILGLEIAIASMRVNEVARFLVNPSYAYGRMGCPPRIPGDASILFEVELIAFCEASALDEFKEMTDEEKRGMSFEKVLEVAKASHAVGNDFYAREMFGKAVRKYMHSINVLESATLKNEGEETQVTQSCIKSYLNMALCHLKLGNFGKAVASGRKVLSLKPKHPKALYICGKSLRHLKSFSEARRFLLKARSLAPKSKDIAVELRMLDDLEVKVNAMERDMCKRMFS